MTEEAEDHAGNDIAPVTRESPSDRRDAARQQFSPVLIVLTALATAGVLIYAKFLLDPSNRGDLLPWLIVIAAEGVLVVHALLAMWTVLSAAATRATTTTGLRRSALSTRRSPTRRRSLGGQRVGVEVFVTVYGEPVEVVRRTVAAALASAGGTAPGCSTTAGPTR